MSTTARIDLDEAEMRLLNARLDMQRRVLRRELTREEGTALSAAFRTALDAVAALRLALPDSPRPKQGATG